MCDHLPIVASLVGKKMLEKARLSVGFLEIVSKFINKIDIVSKLKSMDYLVCNK